MPLPDRRFVFDQRRDIFRSFTAGCTSGLESFEGSGTSTPLIGSVLEDLFLPETNSELSPENQWLEDEFPFGISSRDMTRFRELVFEPQSTVKIAEDQFSELVSSYMLAKLHIEQCNLLMSKCSQV